MPKSLLGNDLPTNRRSRSRNLRPLKEVPEQLQSGVRSNLLQAAPVLDPTVDPTPESCSA